MCGTDQCRMELNPREAAFLLDEMDEIAADDSRCTSARHEARRLQQKAESALTEQSHTKN